MYRVNEMRLNEYLTSYKSRMEPIPEKKFDQLLKTTYSDIEKYYRTGAYRIYRGVGSHLNSFDDHLYMSPSFNRKEQSGAKNVVNLIVNNHSSWQAFPKREICCSSDYDGAFFYGGVYIVYPPNGTKIGVCPNDDFIEMENFLFSPYILSECGDIYCVNSLIEEFLLSNKLKPIDDYNDLIRASNEIEKLRQSKQLKIVNPLVYGFNYYEGSFIDLLAKFVTPKKFDIIKPGDNIPSNRELWMDVPCLLKKPKINEDKF